MRKAAVLLSIIAMALILSIHAGAAVFNVTTTQDHVEGSLRDAVGKANNSDQNSIIHLPDGIYYLSGEADEDDNVGGDLDIDTSFTVTIIGENIEKTIIDGNLDDRVIHILNGKVVLRNITIRSGVTKDSTGGDNNGGGIYSAGSASLSLYNCSIHDNATGNGGNKYGSVDYGSNGGGIFSAGPLTLTDCSVYNNKTGNGLEDPVLLVMGGGNGGGIYSSGLLVLYNCEIHDNTAGDGVRGVSGGGDGGEGGGIYSTGTNTRIISCSIYNNITGKGVPDSIGGDSSEGSSGDGGGIFNKGTMTLTATTVRDNKTRENNNLNCYDSGRGGGIFNAGVLTISGCTVNNNITGDFYRDENGRHSHGGGIFNNGTLTMTNCTVSSNSTGNPQWDSNTSTHRCGHGGGLYNKNTMTLIHCTITGNDTGTYGNGGGIYSDTAFSVKNTIIAGNAVPSGFQGPDCFGTIDSGGYNLVEDTTGCTITGTITGNITGVDPKLDSLKKNGGVTLTHALLTGSPCIDAGSNFGISVDQRNYIRPVDIAGVANANDGTDIGAYEKDSEPSTTSISIDCTDLNFGGISTGATTSSQKFNITKSGSIPVYWSLNHEADWLTCSPAFGKDSGTVTVSVNSSGLAAGSYKTEITITSAEVSNSPQTVSVALQVFDAGASEPPFGSFDTPLNGTTVSGSVPVTGWVLDDIGIENIKIYREPVAGEGHNLIFIGDALQVKGARQDIESAYPDYPLNDQAGWGYMLLTNFLPGQGNGTFTLHALATDKEENTVTLGTTTITCNNADAVNPFGALDTPTQGGTASGSEYINFGWALTPQPNSIPTDGSTITVFVDGVELGNPTYNLYREDIASLFPGYANSDGAVGYFTIDTTQYENGVHTISWVVEDDAGNADGIGSRYFNVQNTTANRQSSKASVQWGEEIPLDYLTPVGIGKGVEKDSTPQLIYPGNDGTIAVEIKELERIVIHLDNNERISSPSSFTAHHSSFSPLTPLPIGSTFDTESGIFYWQPCAGFIGEYEFTFIDHRDVGEKKQRNIRIKINPRFENNRS